MGLRLKNQGFSPDYVETSTALRAFSTAKIICQEINFTLQRIIKNPNLYLASISTWLEIIGKLNNDYNSVMLFGHNPGMTSLVNQVWGLPIDNVPTCGMIILEFEKIKWEKTISVIPKVAEFDFPKTNLKKFEIDLKSHLPDSNIIQSSSGLNIGSPGIVRYLTSFPYPLVWL